MKKLLITILTLFVIACQAGSYRLKNVTVIDGDTIKADIRLGFGVSIFETIRLAGIDTPETRTKNAREKQAGLFVKSWLESKIKSGEAFTLKTEKKEKGKFGRPLGILVIDGVDICQLLISLKYAKKYNGGKKEPWTEKQLTITINKENL